jgi:hypothetical protein
MPDLPPTLITRTRDVPPLAVALSLLGLVLLAMVIGAGVGWWWLQA